MAAAGQIQVHTIAMYYTGESWNGVDQDVYATSKFIKAIKGRPVNQYAYIPVKAGQPPRKLEESNRDDALKWAGAMLAEQLGNLFSSGRACVLVPVPGSHCVSATQVKDCRHYQIAESFASRFDNVTVEARLWWKRKMVKAAEGGLRNGDALLRHLSATADPGDGALLVVFDDVLTSGGHIQAAHAALLASGGKVVDHAICVGRSTVDPDEKKFGYVAKSIDKL